MAEESRTPDLVALTWEAFAAVNRRDLDATMPLYAPEAVLDISRTVGVVPQGRAAIRRFIEDWIAAYEEFEYVPEEPVELGNGVVFAVVSQKARPVGVTGYVHQREGWVCVWVEGLIASITTYVEAEIDDARAAGERLAEERG